MGKRPVTIIICLLLFHFLAWGTAQEGDILILDGEEWKLLYTPLEELDAPDSVAADSSGRDLDDDLL